MKILSKLLLALLIPLSVFAQDDIDIGFIVGGGKKLGARTFDNQGIVGVIGIDSSGNTAISAMSGKAVTTDILTVKPAADANRVHVLSASSDTALTYKFGDATDSQTLTISSASADGDDNDILKMGGGGAASTAQGSYFVSYGNDVATTGGYADVFLGGTASNFRILGNSGAGTLLEIEDTDDSVTIAGDFIFNTAGKNVRVVAYVPTMAATPALGTNQVLPGLNIIPTAAANTAAWLGASTPVPGEQFMIYNNSGAAVRIKGAGAAVINGGTAGKYIEMGIGSYMECKTLSTAIQQCPFYTVNGVVAAMPTPA